MTDEPAPEQEVVAPKRIRFLKIGPKVAADIRREDMIPFADGFRAGLLGDPPVSTYDSKTQVREWNEWNRGHSAGVNYRER